VLAAVGGVDATTATAGAEAAAPSAGTGSFIDGVVATAEAAAQASELPIWTVGPPAATATADAPEPTEAGVARVRAVVATAVAGGSTPIFPSATILAVPATAQAAAQAYANVLFETEQSFVFAG
jgi:hypothetical protein